MRQSRITAEPVAKLIDELGRLPGVGPKSASRLAYYLLRAPKEQALSLAEAILEVKERIVLCSRCFNITETDPCAICQDSERDQSMICVVEEPLDVLALDRTGEFKGLYHVLHGAISPLDGRGPEQLKVAELVRRLEPSDVKEVVLATNPTVEGEATAVYLARLIKPFGVSVTRIAHGIPVGGNLEYADQVTLGRALEGRRQM